MSSTDLSVQTSLSPARRPEIEALSEEAVAFKLTCEARYRFNSRWDNVLTIAGVLLSVGIVSAGVYKRVELSTILGGLVAALVSAQRAFPLGQRAQFYRVLTGQTANLLTDLKTGLDVQRGVETLKILRLDFAQQLPRGSSTPPSGPTQA